MSEARMSGGGEALPPEAKLAAEQCSRLLTVRYEGGTEARLTYFKKLETGWASVFSCMAYVGKNGVGKTMEGDMKTPLGTFDLSIPFGILPDPSVGDPFKRRANGYIHLTEDYYWCGQEGPYYNRMIDNRNPPPGYVPNAADEHLIRYAPSYHYAMFIDYNAEGKFGLGSAIFLHCMGKYPYTAGCVAVEEPVMRELVLELSAGAKIVIF